MAPQSATGARCWRCRSPLVGRRLTVTETAEDAEAAPTWELCSWACVSALVASQIRAADPADKSRG